MDLTFRWPFIVVNSYNKTNKMHQFLKFIFGIKLYMFITVHLSILRRFLLYTQQYIRVCWQPGNSQAVSKPVWHISLLCLQSKTPDDGQRNYPKHVEYYSKNKFEKLVHLVGFIVRIYHDALSPERQVYCELLGTHRANTLSLHFTLFWDLVLVARCQSSFDRNM